MNAISDILCWARGFIAATPGDHGMHPVSIGGLLDMNILLKPAMNEVEKL